jgi:ubiquinone/menaquinone biosynthesis C-methylase UbiE
MNKVIGHFDNADQIAFWNGPGGERWVERKQINDEISRILIDRAQIRVGERVVDIGCVTTITAGEKVGSSGHVVDLDVSEPMLERAKKPAPADVTVEFIQGDATVHRFKTACADLMISRFGVMFFAEPVRSFLNIRTALRSEARM